MDYRKCYLTATVVVQCILFPALAAEEPPLQGSTKEMTSEAAPKHTNRLIDATSPYLLQHAHNPVDWYEWGEEAFAKAVKEDKPIFLSIGYSACHWCHVMEHESFENEGVAEVLNEHFVCVKVDREERPDVDEIYMQVTTAMTGHGGWPMSVILTPQKVPFFAGTYYPREQFIDLLNQIINVWSGDRSRIDQQTDKIRQYLTEWSQGPEPGDDVPAQAVVDKAASTFARAFDKQRGGMSGGGTNKFPPSMAMELMLRVHARTGDKELLSLVELTLDEMARGGIYDQLGGGICRYSTDVQWLVPHFEKMLYDQALVSAIYLAGYQASGNDAYAETARGIFEYVLGDLQSPEGGFYSTRDADSEGMEGAYYIWTVEQIHEVLGPEDGELFCDFYDVTSRGNWFESRGHAPAGPKNILRVKMKLAEYAAQRNLDPGDWEARLATMRAKLLEVRAKRVPPGLDDKVLTGWNGLMIASLAKGARVLDEPRYAQAAAKAADFVMANMRKDGRLLRSYRGGRARLTGYLSDYAFFIEGLLDLHEATFDTKWLEAAAELAQIAKSHYYDESGGGFYFIANDAEELLARTKNPSDGAIPSGNSVHALNLLRLSILRGDKDFAQQAESIFRAFKSLAERQPMGFERLLCAVDFYHGKPKEVAIVGPAESAGVDELLRTVYAGYVPNKVVTFCTGPDDPRAAASPLLTGKKLIDGSPAAYVCESYVCKKPVTTAAELAVLLAAKPVATTAAP